MHIGKVRHPKICEVLGKMKNEDSKGPIRLYKWTSFVHKFQIILHRNKHLKWRFQHRTTLTCAQRTGGGDRCTKTCNWGAWRMDWGDWRLSQHTHALGAWNGAFVPCRLRHYFVTFCAQKPAFLAQNQAETFPINTAFLIHNFSFRTKRFKRKADTRSFQGGVSLSSLQVFIGYVLFLL